MTKREEGFSLIELLTVISIVAILFTLGAFAVRHFWLVRSLEGGKDEIVTQLRQLQQRVGAASNPLVFGARFKNGSAEWELIQYDAVNSPDTCTRIQQRNFTPSLEFDAGVVVQNANFSSYTNGTRDVTAICKAGTFDDVVFFFAKGTATSGRIRIRQPVLDRTETICVTGITGRVEERETGSC